MKLLEKNTRYMLRILPGILLICTLLFFLLLRRQTRHLQEKQLLLKLDNISESYRHTDLNSVKSIIGEYEITQSKSKINASAYLNPVDTLIYYPSKKDFIPFEMMTRDVKQGSSTYHLTTFVSSVEITHLKIAVLGSQILIYLILFYSIFKINRKLSIKLWAPFYQTTETLEHFDLSKNQTVELSSDTGIDEFNNLNKSINQLNERNLSVYRSQKQFVENASHEIQTPLAIIQSKAELLIEQENMTAESAALITDITEATNRLIKLNKTLILLSKIENQSFLERSAVRLDKLLEDMVLFYSNQYLENMPAINLALADRQQIIANVELMEILCSNLIRNAIVHNVPGGFINISLYDNKMVIENSGGRLNIDPAMLFERFRTGNDLSKKSTGLGLAIVKQIADIHNFKTTYHIDDHLHKIEVCLS